MSFDKWIHLLSYPHLCENTEHSHTPESSLVSLLSQSHLVTLSPRGSHCSHFCRPGLILPVLEFQINELYNVSDFCARLCHSI